MPPQRDRREGDAGRRGRRRGDHVSDLGVRVRLADLEPRLRPRRPRRWLRRGLPPRLLPREHGPQGHAAVPREDRHARAQARSNLLGSCLQNKGRR